MKLNRVSAVAICALIITVFSCTSVPKKAAGPDPKELVAINGQRLFMSGMNIAWINFNKDLDQFNEARFTQAIEDVAMGGGNTVRWWLHITGNSTPAFDPETNLCTGISDESLAFLKRGLDIALERRVGIMLCLWSFGMLDQAQGANYDRSMKLLTDDAAMQAYIDKALVPMVQSVGNHPGILGWEIFNEPEGMATSFGWTPRKVNIDVIQKFVNRTAGAIHRANPKALVTNGSWSIQVLTDVDGLYNYYTDVRLIAAGGDKDGYLDYYTVHYYPEYFDEALSPFHHPKSYWGLDKPLVIAEFPAAGLKNLGKGFKLKEVMTPEECYRYAMDNGYAGALGWTWTAHDGFGSVIDASAGMSALQIDYEQYIRIDVSKLPPIPKVLKPFGSLVLDVNKGKFDAIRDMLEYFDDGKGGKVLEFRISKNSDPELAEVSVGADGKMNVVLPGKKTGSSTILLDAVNAEGQSTMIKIPVVVLDSDRGNIALFKPVQAKSEENDTVPIEYVNDGNLKTRWSSLYKDDEWISIDLQGTFRVTKAVLAWEAAFGQVYSVEGSMDGESWTPLAQVAEGRGGTVELTFPATDVKYVRMYGTKRGTQWGFSLWELELHGERVK